MLKLVLAGFVLDDLWLFRLIFWDDDERMFVGSSQGLCFCYFVACKKG